MCVDDLAYKNTFRILNMAQVGEHRNQEATIYVGNLDDRVNEALLWELFTQAAPIVNVFIPRDRISQSQQNYAFIEFQSETDADYATRIMNMIKLYNKPIRINKAAADKRNTDIGAILFIGNLDPELDEKMLYDTFGTFGTILSTRISRETDSQISKGYGFVSFDNFESSDAAIDAMNGQFLMNKPITASYAFKKDGSGERHGTAAERLLASQEQQQNTREFPHRIFVEGPGS